MVENEVGNIADLEQEEALINSELFPFDVSSEQVEIPPGFNFSGLIDVAGTAVEASGSSQGS